MGLGLFMPRNIGVPPTAAVLLWRFLGNPPLPPGLSLWVNGFILHFWVCWVELCALKNLCSPAIRAPKIQQPAVTSLNLLEGLKLNKIHRILSPLNNRNCAPARN